MPNEINNPYDPENQPDLSSMADEEINEETAYVTPQEVDNMKKRLEKEVIDSTSTLDSDINLTTEISIDEAVASINKVEEDHKHKGELKVVFESMGRFDLPDTVFLEGYKTRDISDLTLARDEDILPILVRILDERKFNSKASFKDALIEEFYEVLINMKAQFDKSEHVFHYYHDCQNRKPDHEKKLSTFKVDLRTIKYRSITEAEEVLRNDMKKIFDTMTYQEFVDEYVIKVYGKDINTTMEEELKKVRIKEPMKYKRENGDVLSLRFSRVKDLIFGIQVASRMFTPKINKIKNTTKNNMSKEDLDEWKNVEIEKLEYEKIKTAIEYTKSQCLLSVNGKPFATQEQQVKYYGGIDLKETNEIAEKIDYLAFGIYDKRDMTCEHCQVTDEGRSLSQFISPTQLLPIKTDKGDGTTGKVTRHTIGNLSFSG